MIGLNTVSKAKASEKGCFRVNWFLQSRLKSINLGKICLPVMFDVEKSREIFSSVQ